MLYCQWFEATNSSVKHLCTPSEYTFPLISLLAHTRLSALPRRGYTDCPEKLNTLKLQERDNEKIELWGEGVMRDPEFYGGGTKLPRLQGSQAVPAPPSGKVSWRKGDALRR
jgi:hypothetical protein